VYKVPPFFEDYILSDDMIYIIIKLLQQNPENRFKDLAEVRSKFIELRENILHTPFKLRQLLGHPILPDEHFFDAKKTEHFPELNNSIGFQNNILNSFGLKYLAKFALDNRIELLSINGGHMPLNQMKMNNLVLLNLSNCGLYSEDLFVLS